MINGAWGGRWNRDGIEAVTNPAQNMSNLPVETLEARYPLMMEEYSLRPDSCGAGEYRGGLGLIRQYRLLAEEAVLQVRADRHDHSPYGLFGGKPAARCINILDPEGEHIVLPAKITRTIGKNVVVRHEQAGGGGFGNPLLRSIELIQDDLDNGKITQAYAIEHHGVVFATDGVTIDAGATQARRSPRS
jgi:N-methylhydantoinase B